MSFKYGKKSKIELEKVDPRLKELMEEALRVSPVDITITEGLRSSLRQEELVKEGKSKTLKSKHLSGKAVDFAPCIRGRVSFNRDDAIFLSGFILAVARIKGLKVRVGSIWDHESITDNSFVDAFHVELVD